jgi:hypothetical protein
MGPLDARTAPRRRLRRGLAIAACTALLGLTACGAEEGTGTPSPSDPPASSQDEESTTAAAASDGGGEGSDPQDGAGADEGAGDDEGDPGASGERTRILLVTELGIDEASGDGAPVLTGEELAALLVERYDGEAECADELVLEIGQSTGCVGPEKIEGETGSQDWLASTVAVPSEDGLANGYQVAVLFSTGTALPEGASALTDEGVSLTGVGFGSMFGAEPLDAETLADSTLQTLTSEFAYVPVADEADWSEVTCEDGLDFTEFRTVDCTATTAEGEDWALHVAPGTYFGADQGLLVGIVRPTGS